MTVVISGRDTARAAGIAKEIGGDARGIAVDLSEPESIAAGLADVERVDHLVLAAIERDMNTVAEYDVARRCTW